MNAQRPGGAPPADPSPLRGAVIRYRALAYIVGVLLIVLVFVGIPLQVFAHQDAIVQYVGTTHGILYMVYLITAYTLARRLRLPLGQTIVVLLAGTIPVMTFVVERWVTRRYLTPARLHGGSATAATAEASRQA